MVYTVAISIMHMVHRRQILCIIRIMQYQIWYVLHEIDGLKLTTRPSRYQEWSAFLPSSSSLEDGLGIHTEPLQT